MTVEDTVMTQQGLEGNTFDMKVGDTREIDVGKGLMKTLTLKAVDEVTNPDSPTATFGLQDTLAIRVVPMGNDVNAAPAPAMPGPAPGQAPPPPAPGQVPK